MPGGTLGWARRRQAPLLLLLSLSVSPTSVRTARCRPSCSAPAPAGWSRHTAQPGRQPLGDFGGVDQRAGHRAAGRANPRPARAWLPLPSPRRSSHLFVDLAGPDRLPFEARRPPRLRCASARSRARSRRPSARLPPRWLAWASRSRRLCRSLAQLALDVLRPCSAGKRAASARVGGLRQARDLRLTRAESVTGLPLEPQALEARTRDQRTASIPVVAPHTTPT